MLALLAAMTAGVPAIELPARAQVSTPWSGWVTSPDPTRPDLHLARAQQPTTGADSTLTVDTTRRGQTWLGVGAAVTDASVKLIRENSSLLDLFFSPSKADGARLNLLRLPLSATDFSYDSEPGDPYVSRDDWAWTDPNAPPLEVRRAIDVVTLAKRRNTQLSVVGTPWSAPKSLKTSNTLNGGDLKPGSESAYADLLAGQARTLLARGVPLRALTVGNEPGFNDGPYPTMGMSDPQVAAVAAAVKAKLSDTGVALWAHDHNWEDWAHAGAQLATAPTRFSAVAFHCYGGNPDQMALVGRAPIVTECTGTQDGWPGTFKYAETLVVDAVNAGSTGLLFWNLALRAQDNGPRSSTGGCRTCRGLVTITPSGAIERGPEFYELAHLARAAQPQAIHVGLDASSPTSPVKAVAFQNPDGSVGIFGHNDSSSPQVVAVAGAGTPGRFTVPGGAIFTFLSAPGQPSKPLNNIRPFTVIRVAATGASWYVDGSLRKHWIRDGETYLCLAARRVPLLDGLTQATADTLRDGEWQPQCLAPPRFELKILQAPDNVSYFVQGGVRHWIPDGGTFLCLKAWKGRAVTTALTWDQVNSIAEDPNAHASCTPDGAGGRVIREAKYGTSWYVDTSLRKHWIPDGETYFCMIARYPLLDGLTQEHADALADGDWVPPC